MRLHHRPRRTTSSHTQRHCSFRMCKTRYLYLYSHSFAPFLKGTHLRLYVIYPSTYSLPPRQQTSPALIAMDKLPQEVVDKITGFMFPLLAKKTDEEYDRHPHNKRYAPCNYERDDLSAAPYATLSPVWKRSIEQLTFWILKIRSHSDALIAEEAMSRDLHRRNSVRRIAWTINLDVERTSSFPHIRDKVIVVEFRNMLEFINRIRVSPLSQQLCLFLNRY